MNKKYFYLCDKKACENCNYPTCKHTEKIEHAINEIAINIGLFVHFENIGTLQIKNKKYNLFVESENK